jgi:Mg2+ and Co2+ transporter CorA
MPISFLAGFFGMNFFQPIAESLYFLVDVPVFILALFIFIGGPTLMLFWMKKRGWL